MLLSVLKCQSRGLIPWRLVFGAGGAYQGKFALLESDRRFVHEENTSARGRGGYLVALHDSNMPRAVNHAAGTVYSDVTCFKDITFLRQVRRSMLLRSSVGLFLHVIRLDIEFKAYIKLPVCWFNDRLDFHGVRWTLNSR